LWLRNSKITAIRPILKSNVQVSFSRQANKLNVTSLGRGGLRGIVHLLSYLVTVLLYGIANRRFRPENVKSIILFQIDRLGDVVMSVPVIQALRRIFPSARLTMVVHPAVEEFARRLCDKVCTCKSTLVYDIAGRKPSLVYSLKKAVELRKEKYDLIVDLRSDFMTLIFAALKGGRYRVDVSSGCIIPAAKKLWCALRGRAYKVENPVHETDRRLLALEKLGIEATRHAFPVSFPVVTAEEKAYVSEMLKKLGILDKPKVVIQPGAAWKYRMWQGVNVAKLADKLINEFGVEVLLTGSADEANILDCISEGMENKPVCLAGRTSISQLAALMQLSEIVIANDSLAAHLAALVKTPVVVLFGPQDPRLFAPRGDNVVVIKKYMPCSPCAQDICLYPENNCMSLISVEEVFAAVSSVLAGKVCCGK
jgi:ADP-heptose:LPS heptosyltransferase